MSSSVGGAPPPPDLTDEEKRAMNDLEYLLTHT
jgi:hypothetical protein